MTYRCINESYFNIQVWPKRYFDRGGLEDLLKGVEKHETTFEEGTTLAGVILFVKEKMLKANQDLFAKENTVYGIHKREIDDLEFWCW